MPNVRLDAKTHEDLVQLGKDNGLSIQDMVQQALSTYIEDSRRRDVPAVHTPKLPKAAEGDPLGGAADCNVRALRDELAREKGTRRPV